MEKTYFAKASTQDIGTEIQAKVDDYYKFLSSSSLVDLWRKSYYAYFGLHPDAYNHGVGMFAIGGLTSKGAQGELCGVKINHFRNLVTHQLSALTANKPALSCRAINSDSQSIAAADLGDGVLDFYLREKEMTKHFRAAAEIALVMGEGWLRFDWDATSGSQYAVDDIGQPVMNGDLSVKVYNPFDVIRDTTAASADKLTWHICHELKSRHELSAKYPELADKILATSIDTAGQRRFIDPTKVIQNAGVGQMNTDLIDVYEFLHPPSQAIPEGRYTITLEGGLVLFDGPYPFTKPCLHKVSGADIIGAPFGWTLSFDLVGIQELVDKLYSTVASNQMASGIQNYWQPPGNELTVTQISGGLNLLESVVKPEVLQLLSTPPEIFNFIGKLESVMETLSGISAVNRGQAPENLKSGAALAFVASQAVTFASQLQQSYNELLERSGDSIVSLLHDYGTTPRLAFIVGKFKRPIMREFIGKDLEGVDRVVCETTNSVSKTTAGKIQIAQDLLQAGLIRNAREYLTVVETGQLDPLLEGEMSEIINVHAENEDLQQGKYPQALICDDHKLHVLEHRALLGNPDSRRDYRIVGNAGLDGMTPRSGVLGHIQDHIDLSNSPAYAPFGALLGVPPLPMAQPMGAPPPNAGPPNMAAQQAPMGGPPEIAPPNMPNLPANAGPQDQAKYQQLQAQQPQQM